MHPVFWTEQLQNSLPQHEVSHALTTKSLSCRPLCVHLQYAHIDLVLFIHRTLPNNKGKTLAKLISSWSYESLFLTGGNISFWRKLLTSVFHAFQENKLIKYL